MFFDEGSFVGRPADKPLANKQVGSQHARKNFNVRRVRDGRALNNNPKRSSTTMYTRSPDG